MSGEQILAIILPPLITALVAIVGAGVPVLLSWLKKQKIVQQFHLEELLDTLMPKATTWVEYWAENIYKPSFGQLPSGELKAAKGVEFVKAELPKGIVISDDRLRLRIEGTLKMNEEGPWHLDKEHETSPED